MRGLLLLLVFFVGVPLVHTIAGDQNTLVEAGIPAPSREWSGDDYLLTAQILAAGKVPLPRLTDEEGRQFIQRLTATENFSFYRNRTLPLPQRMDNFFKLVGGANAIDKQYFAAANQKLDVHQEVARQEAFLLHLTAVGVELIDEFLPTIPKDDKYPVRMAGLKQAYDGLTTVFVGAETSLADTSFYSPDDLSLIIEAMADSLPTTKRAFSSDYKLELRKKLESRRTSSSYPEDVRRFQKMINELDG